MPLLLYRYSAFSSTKNMNLIFLSEIAASVNMNDQMFSHDYCILKIMPEIDLFISLKAGVLVVWTGDKKILQ